MKKLILFLFCAFFSVGMNATDYFVALAANGGADTNSGLSWDAPKLTITAAVNLAKTATPSGNGTGADNIYVKAGTFGEKVDLTATNCDNINLYGGYPVGNSGTSTANRDIINNVTIIDGGGVRQGVLISKDGCTVDGFTVQNGYLLGYSGNTAVTNAGGVVIAANSTVSNCIIKDNKHERDNFKVTGGGVYIDGGTLSNCIIIGNLVGPNPTKTNNNTQGGGIQIVKGIVDKCKICNNTATLNGGGIFVGTLYTGTLTNMGANATDYQSIKGSVTISNCVIYNNGKQGIIVGLKSGETNTVTLINNTIANNQSVCSFTGISTTTLTSTNNIFSNNGAVENFTILSSFTYNAINMASNSGTNIALANTNTSAGFVSPSSVNGYNAVIPASVTSANWNLGTGSVCKNAGTGSGNGSFDVAGNARLVDAIDMGAYEAYTSTISEISPSTAGSGTTVTITGTNFTGATGVSFGVTAATSFTVISNTSITAVVGAGTSGSVSVTTPGGGTATIAGFTYSVAATPTITGISPSTAASGTTVTITGTNLTGASAVSFGGTAAASFTVVSATSITAVVGAGTSGSVSVTTSGGTATLAGFTYLPTPTITSIDPTTAASGATVTITGTNLSGATAVSFGGTAAASFTAAATSITAVVGAGATGSVSVTTPGGTATLAGFIFSAGGDPAPTITFASTPINKTYGDALFTQTASSNSGGAITYSSGSTGVATVNSTTGEVTIVSVGSAIITATQAAASGSYSAGSTTYTVVVAAKALTITATGPSKTYGTALTTGTSVSNFTAGATGVGSEVVTSVTLTPNAVGLSATAVAGAAYIVTPSMATGTGGFLASNYSITYTGYDGTVASKALTITANGPSKIYGTALTAGTSATNFTAGATGVGSELVTSVTLTPDAAGLSATTSAVTAYVVTPSLATGTGGFLASNYDITYTGYNGTVATKALTITGLVKANKVYDGLTTATFTGTAAYTGLVNSEAFTVTGTPTANFVDANVGTSKTVTVSGYDAPSANYTVNSLTLTANITTKALTITGLAGVNKPYDGTNAATFTGTAAYSGLVNGEVYSVTGTPVANFQYIPAGYVINIFITGYTAPTANYTVSQPSFKANITKVALTITGLTGENKPYDGTTSASFTGTPEYSGLVNGETFPVTGTPTASFANATAAGLKTITITGYDVPSANYTLTSTVTGNITKVALTVGSPAVTSKTYTGTNAAVITGSLIGILNLDAVTLTGTGTFASVDVSNGIAVTSTSTLAGTKAVNYSLTQPTGLTGNITAKNVTITGLTGDNKPYDGTTSASFTGTPDYSGLVNGETITVTGTPIASFATATAANSKPITVIGYDAPSANYSLTQPTLNGNITKVPLTITADNQSVIFGSAAATVTGAGTYTPTGFVNSEGVGVINGSATYTTTYSNTTPAATLETITPDVSGLSATNYSFTPANGTISIDAQNTKNVLPNTAPNIGDLGVDAGTDLTVPSTGTLIVNASPKVNSVTVDAGGKLNVASPIIIETVTLKAGKDASTFSAKIDAKITATTVRLFKTIDATKWYFMSFPCDVTVAAITKSDGNSLGNLGFGGDWYIKYYDGAQRAESGTTIPNWKHIALAPDPTKLLANHGYIFGLKTGGDVELSIPLNPNVLHAEANGTVPVTAFTGTAAGNHYGWNLIGIPYMSNFNGNGRTSAPFMSFIDGNSITYTALSNAQNTSIPPMAAYFVQVGNGGTTITFDKLGRQSAKSAVTNDLSDRVQLNFASATGVDNTNLIMDNNQSTAYEIGQDFEKTIGLGSDKPQVYSMLGGVNYAFNALPMNNVTNLPIGFYTKTAGSTTISVDASGAPSLSGLLLTDYGVSPAKVTDLLISNYTFTTAAGTNNSRFAITAQRIPTAIDIETDVNAPILVINNSKLIINNLDGKASVRVFDALGRMVANKTASDNSFEINISAKGMYTVQIEAGGKNWVKKIVF